TYPIVSAASIIAKVKRDTAIASLRKQHGDLGSGYPSDPKTIEFLKKWIKTRGSYPEFVRKSWKPARRIQAGHDALQRELL
ncbi:MAG: ribonuclease HII, partial [Candidatus Bathyarchaeota archaeon]|nr:ribonuclease HII [Candidatus Bathyarchaeota archaeon]